MIAYGALLRAIRKRAGLSQEKLAEKLNRTKSCISKFENNNKMPDMHTFLEWIKKTNSGDVLIAMGSGLDVQSIIQQVLQIVGAA